MVLINSLIGRLMYASLLNIINHPIFHALFLVGFFTYDLPLQTGLRLKCPNNLVSTSHEQTSKRFTCSTSFFFAGHKTHHMFVFKVNLQISKANFLVPIYDCYIIWGEREYPKRWFNLSLCNLIQLVETGLQAIM